MKRRRKSAGNRSRYEEVFGGVEAAQSVIGALRERQEEEKVPDLSKMQTATEPAPNPLPFASPSASHRNVPPSGHSEHRNGQTHVLQ